jgi:serine/threonine protein kinase
MVLSPGTRLGPYEVTAQIGVGGMGEVYRATDTHLGRNVAIKVLPDAFAHDAERLARFEREARTLAALNHPNIAAVYELEKSAGTHALVMELVEGPTLADRVARGAMPLDEALPIAKQMAEALEAAHELGIIHRDLKPANVKVRPDGTVKVLDFGLAKAMEPGGISDPHVSQSPTITTPAMTQMGVILGTAAYMSPEQAKGRAADRRSDMWAFGCVVYEMLAGRRAFAGDDIADTLANVLRGEPDWNLLPPETPAPIHRLLRRCLVKDPKRRVGDVSTARIEIDDAEHHQSEPDRSLASRPSHRERIILLSMLALVTLVAGVAIVLALRPEPSRSEMRLEITTPPTTDPASLAISPDGEKLVFVANSDGRPMLWLRPLASVAARPLPRSDGATYPFWSPDSRSVGFFAEGKLKRVDIDGGSAQTLTNVLTAAARGGSWGRDGTILFANVGSPILRIPATGGEPTAVTRLETSQGGAPISHRFPQFLPDGRHFLYYLQGSSDVTGVYVAQLDGSNRRRLLAADAAASFAPSGHLLFVRQGTLFAQNFDPTALALTGNPFSVAESVVIDAASTNLAALSSSAAGRLVYRTGSASRQRKLVWFDRSGKEIAKVGDPDDDGALNPSLSPDGRYVALQRTVNANPDIWLIDIARGVRSRLTFETSTEYAAVWSPDGSRIAFNSNPKNVYDLYQKSAAGIGSEQLLLTTPQLKTPMDWSPDGRFLLYRSLDPTMNWDLWALPLEGDRKPFPVVQTNFEERDGQFSPDGRWIAYVSNESGRFEIYIQPFSGPEGKFAGKWQISTNGGGQVRWRRDGKEVFYVGLDGKLMAVPIRISLRGTSVEPTAPVPLFAARLAGLGGSTLPQYMVAADGQSFLMNTVTEDTASPITVVLNWTTKR